MSVTFSARSHYKSVTETSQAYYPFSLEQEPIYPQY